MHKKRSFPLRISSVNVTESAEILNGIKKYLKKYLFIFLCSGECYTYTSKDFWILLKTLMFTHYKNLASFL